MIDRKDSVRPQRHDGRTFDELRPIKASLNVFEHAAGSLLLEVGKTKVLCAVTIQQGVPPFMRGKGCGWLTAEYAMLPASTEIRTPRESSSVKKSGRSVEISRLIGRTLRAITDLERLGERTIAIDCDVLQADGGTRTASITAACFALKMAQERWLSSRMIANPILRESAAAVAVAVEGETVLLDPDFIEDSSVDADFNFVVTSAGRLIEIQGGAEKQPISWQQFDQVRALALKGIAQMFAFFEKEFPINQDTAIEQLGAEHKKVSSQRSAALFSLANRQKHAA